MVNSSDVYFTIYLGDVYLKGKETTDLLQTWFSQV